VNQQTALAQLGVTDQVMSDVEKRQLDADGYVIREDALTSAQVGAIVNGVARLTYEQRIFGMEHPPYPGSMMVYGITEKDPDIGALLTHPFPWAAARHVFDDDDFSGGNGDHKAPQAGSGQQPLRRDAPTAPGDFDKLIVMFVAVDMPETLSPPRVVPGSHRWGRDPTTQLENPLLAHPQEVLLTAKAGAIIVFNASLWHGGTRNQSFDVRWSVVANIDRHRGARPPARPVPAPLSNLTSAATYLLGTNPHLDNTISSSDKPCWCCGTERRCRDSGVIPVAALARGKDGVIIPPDDSFAEYGFPLKPSLSSADPSRLAEK
jgi:hypothetical protein